jgi:hypothetical protein
MGYSYHIFPRILRIQPSSFHCRPAIALSVAYEMALTVAVPFGPHTGVERLSGTALRFIRLPGPRPSASASARRWATPGPSLEERFSSREADVAKVAAAEACDRF